jgi:hypothetical protein
MALHLSKLSTPGPPRWRQPLTQLGAEEYIRLRTEWDRYIIMLAPKFAYDMAEIDTALAKVKP